MAVLFGANFPRLAYNPVFSIGLKHLIFTPMTYSSNTLILISCIVVGIMFLAVMIGAYLDSRD